MGSSLYRLSVCFIHNHTLSVPFAIRKHERDVYIFSDNRFCRRVYEYRADNPRKT